MIRRSFVEKPYVSAAVWIALLTLSGFWASYYGRLPFGVADKSLFIHIHAFVFSGWLVILVAQTIFAAQGQIQKHMALGRIGIYWGWSLFAMGLLVSLHVFQRDLAADGLEAVRLRLVGPFFDMLLFAPVFALAVSARHKPARHKRLMLVAVSIMLMPAIFRLLTSLGISSRQLAFFLWISPLLVAQAWDFARKRGASPIYLLAMVLVPLSGPARMVVGETVAWAEFTGFLANALG